MPRQAEARQTRIRKEVEQRRRVLEVAARLSGTLGADFFQSIVKHLADTFEADYAYLGEIAGTPTDRIRTVAVVDRSGPSAAFEHVLSATTSGQVLSDGVFSCSRDVRAFFPVDQFIQTLEAESYIGVRLSDSGGQAIGVLAIASRRPITNMQVVRPVLEAFVPRAAAELERKRSEDARRENQERYQAFISMNPDPMWRVEFEQPIPLTLSEDQQLDRIYRFGYVAECNRALAKLAGAEAMEELLGWRLDEVTRRIHPGLREELLKSIRSGFQNTTVETSSRDAAGQPFFRLRSQFGIVEDGELRRIWGTTRDITALRRTELSLAGSERSFRAVLKGIKLPAVMLDLNGTVTFANDCFLGLTRRSREDVFSATWLEGLVPDGDLEMWKKAILPDVLGGHATFHFEGSILPPGGKPHLIAWDTICLFHDLNELTGVAAIGMDITRQRALERQIRQTEKLEGIGRLAAGVAHDFNNLLTIVLGNANHLLQSTAQSHPSRERLASIEKAAIQCSQLTAELLAFGRKQRMQPDRINLNDVIRENESIIRGLISEIIELTLDLASTKPWVNIDRSQLQRALTNLITNARDAMPDGGTLTVATANISIHTGDPNYPEIPAGDYVRLSVADSGTGFSEEILSSMFEPFFTTKPPGKGTGLGLATVYGIVTQSGGHIIVRGGFEKGAKFEILLPEAQFTN